MEGENPLLKLASQIGLSQDAIDEDADQDWTPDKVPPAVRRAKADDVPQFEAFAATFGRAAGGKGIVMNGSGQTPAPEMNMTEADKAGTRKAVRGYHKDGSPRDALESASDCENGFCSICR
jgi:hypothetical protein